MNASQALRRITKALGKRAGIRDSKRPTSPAQREVARIARADAMQRMRAAESAMNERRRAILDADPEYVNLRDAYKAATADRDAAYVGYRYSAGVDSGWFFRVEAEADNLAELVEKVESKVAA